MVSNYDLNEVSYGKLKLCIPNYSCSSLCVLHNRYDS